MLSETMICNKDSEATSSDFCLTTIKWNKENTSIIVNTINAANCVGSRFVSGKLQIVPNKEEGIIKIYTKAEKPSDRRDIRIYLCGLLDAFGIENEYTEYY